MKIEWSLHAKKDYWQNIDYLEREWNEKVVENFIHKVEESITLLSQKNIAFIKTDYKGVYKFVIIKQVTLFYYIDSETIYLLRFWNNYQDLENFKLQ